MAPRSATLFSISSKRFSRVSAILPAYFTFPSRSNHKSRVVRNGNVGELSSELAQDRLSRKRMRYAVLSDIAGDLAALRAGISDAVAQKCEEFVCLGDIVGSRGSSAACVELVRELNMPTVKGDLDQYCATDGPLDNFAASAVEWIMKARSELSGEQKSWLNHLPLILDLKRFTCVHATLASPERWGYVFDKIAATESFRLAYASDGLTIWH
jgi:hypothetical protein